MLLPTAIAFAIIPFAFSIDYVEIQEEPVGDDDAFSRVVYDGYPMAIVCDEFNDPFAEYFLADIAPDAGNDNQYPDAPTDNTESEYFECTIQKNGEVIYNETIISAESKEKGYFADADKSWDQATVLVQAKWDSARNESQKITIKLKRLPANHTCPESPVSQQEKEVVVGTSDTLPCVDVHWRLTEEQFNNLSFVWYHDCDAIASNDPEYRITTELFSVHPIDGIIFSQLQIMNASLRSTPGTYRCLIQKVSASANDNNAKLVLNSYSICLKRPYLYSNQPYIAPYQDTYVVAPGSSLNITANGNSGEEVFSISKAVLWYKHDEKNRNLTLLCDDRSSTACTTAYYENQKYCKPLSDKEIADTFNHELGDEFVANFALRDLTKKDEGLYTVALLTTQPAANATFRVKVELAPKEQKNWTIAFVVVGVLILIGVIALLILHTYRTDVKYFRKKIFNGRPIRDTRPIAYLVYSPDVFQKNGRNPYQAVLNFIGGRRFYDPNNPGLLENAAGCLESEHVEHMLKQCMTMIVFVTREMLNKNNGKMEEFEAYKGFNENVQNGLPIIFICTKGVRKRTNLEEFNNNNVIFRNFMHMRRNTVIYWDENHPNQFRRALYVALPNVEDPRVNEISRI